MARKEEGEVGWDSIFSISILSNRQGGKEDRVQHPASGPDRHAPQDEDGLPGDLLQYHGETLGQRVGRVTLTQDLC